MKNILTARQAGNTLLVLFSLMIVFHLVVIMGFVPIDMVWGGKLETMDELVVAEIIAILITLLGMATVAIRIGTLNAPRLAGAAKVLMWIMVVLFVLNTIGNAFAETDIERYAGGAATLLLSFLSWRVATSA